MSRPDNVATTAAPTMTYLLEGRRRATAIRLSVARDLGRDIDGAWWPRVHRISNELPGLIAALTPLVGNVSSINANWSPIQAPPDFNCPGWEGKRQHLLIIPYATYSALALMVLRCAAGLPIDAADRNKPAFLTAGCILRAAHQQCATP
jgi:Family of unknown function (DUF5994)